MTTCWTLLPVYFAHVTSVLTLDSHVSLRNRCSPQCERVQRYGIIRLGVRQGRSRTSLVRTNPTMLLDTQIRSQASKTTKLTTHSSPDNETGLHWSVSGNKISATGCGKDPCYYTFDGTLAADGTISGNVIDSATTKTVGTWSAKAGAPEIPSHCGQSNDPYIWPLPKKFSKVNTFAVVTPKASGFFTSATGSSPFLEQAFARYTTLTFPHNVGASSRNNSNAPSLTGLSVTVDSLDDSHPQLDTDESYTLSIPATGGSATLTAKTVYGALRALETFSQAVTFDYDARTYKTFGWEITDSPRFPHRGLMVDTARHWQPVSSLKMMISSLPFAKINVLHWHMSDTQSFPLESHSAPKLWQASWSPQERYVQEDVAEVVEFARLHGVRVMVEFDVSNDNQHLQ